MKTLLTSFVYAIQNIRNHFFHTVLSVLGIVIGVAALVAILSLIDGMEQFAREQLARTTSVKGILVSTETSVTRNGISIPKDSVQVFDYTAYRQINSALAGSASVNVCRRNWRRCCAGCGDCDGERAPRLPDGPAAHLLLDGA